MKKDIKLTPEQRTLVENHLSIVHWVIITSIDINNSVYGFGYDDLFQEGCLCLCKAASTYDVKKSQFPTYAKRVVLNGLISHCRRICRHQNRFRLVDFENQGELVLSGRADKHMENFIYSLSMFETLDLLESRKPDYEGITRRGIEALELKIQGNHIADIAALYQVPSSHVGAWISRAAAKLRKDPKFTTDIQ